jgi:tetratricopeptide (TPR) repeat protein
MPAHAFRTFYAAAVVVSAALMTASGAVARAQTPAAADHQADPLDLVREARKLNSDGKQAEALAVYDRALAASPDLFDADIGAGVALDLVGRYGEARRHFAHAIETAAEGEKNQALTTMAVSWAFESNAKQASTFYRQVFDRQMASTDYGGAAGTANALGRVYLESGDPDNAYRWYQTGYETIRRQRDLPASEADLWDMRWAHAQARIAARRGRSAEAQQQVAAVKALLDKGGNDDERIQYPYVAGYVKFYLKDYAGAIAELQNASQTDPFIVVLLAQAYEKSGDATRAREAYTKVLASNAHSLNNAFARPIAKRRMRS